MASVCSSSLLTAPTLQSEFSISHFNCGVSLRSSFVSSIIIKRNKSFSGRRVTCAFGDVTSGSTTYLIGGAIAIALIGTAFPILFSRKDLCPDCDGAGFIRKTGQRLNANAARKDLSQIVCPRCKGLGKLAQVDK